MSRRDPQRSHRVVGGTGNLKRDRIDMEHREDTVRRLANEGVSDSEIALVLDVTDRTVLRTRQRLGIPSRWHEVHGIYRG